MLLDAPGTALRLVDVPAPVPARGEILIQVRACGVCRTDLHVLDGDLSEARCPVIPGHQIIGTIVEVGTGVRGLAPGQRVGVPWLGGSCGACAFCAEGRENLCDSAVYTGYQRDGGFAEFCVANSGFCFPVPSGYPDLQAAPLLCAGLIGHRALGRTGRARRLGLYGFGAAAHILTQVAVHEGREVYAFTRRGDASGQAFARELGALWAGDSLSTPPVALDAAIIFAPAGELVPAALAATAKGATVVCAGIHMSDIPSFPYASLWGERSVCSIANLTRRDAHEFLALAPTVPIRTEVHAYPLAAANEALEDLRHGRFNGAAVIVVDEAAR